MEESYGGRVSAIIKLGGAALTHKTRLEELNPEILSRVVTHISDLCNRGRRVIIVHGAGGFGHHQARAGGLSDGGSGTPEAARRCAAETHASVVLLNAQVVAALIGAGVPAVGVSPIGVWATCARELVCGNEGRVVCDLLGAGLVPVLHGDVVVDSQQNFSVLSGDTIVARLCQVFRPEVAVFMTNVAGVYDRPPELPGAQLIRRITMGADSGWYGLAGLDGGVLGLQTGDVAGDVTGAMGGKVLEAGVAAQFVRRSVRIVHAATANALAACEDVLPPGWAGTEVWQGGGGLGGA